MYVIKCAGVAYAAGCKSNCWVINRVKMLKEAGLGLRVIAIYLSKTF